MPHIEELKNQISEIELKVSDYETMMGALLTDLDLLSEGYESYFIIDFSELYRYMHPLNDRTRRSDLDTFWWEQIVLRYFIETSGYNIVWIKPYYQEFLRHLKQIKAKLSKLKYKSFLKDSRVEKLIEMIESEKYGKEDVEKIWAEIQIDYSDFLSREHADEYLQAITKLYGHVGKNIDILSKIYDRDNIIPYNINPDENENYLENLRKINKSRSDNLMLINNKTDALAMTITYELNKLNNQHKKIFYLCTSSTRIFPTVKENSILIQTENTIFKTHIGRNLYYILFRLSFEGIPVEESKKVIEKHLHLLKRYKREVLRLQSGTIFITDGDLDDFSGIFSEVIDVFEYFETLINLQLFLGIDANWVKSTKVTTRQLKKLYDSFEFVIKDKTEFTIRLIESSNKVEKCINDLEADIEKLFERE